ncbi:MAG: DNA cytosine methyltransferase [Actinomycetota bacterium]|nr:DNA cytosine methyltransferase [Actinomycetota bacterium]
MLHGFAGPGGWEEGQRLAGFTGQSVGFELCPVACATGQAAGHQRVRADVAQVPLKHLAGKVAGVVLSPPCPSFSTAGSGAGKDDVPNVLRLIADFAASRTPGDYEWADERSALTAQPMRWVVECRPRWVALEQVPPVLPIWRYIAECLRKLGYRVWCGVLSAEEFGVPQTRKRAILVASLDGPVGPPTPTHQAYISGRDLQAEPDLFGDPLPPPVSMAEALGWGADELIGFPRRADTPSNGVEGDDSRIIELGGVDYRARDLRPAPAPALTEKSRSWQRWRTEEVVMLTAARTKLADGTLPRPAPAPAPTIAFGHASMVWALRNGTQDNACTRPLDEPAGTIFYGGRGNAVDWVAERPATTVQGDPRIWPPGHKVNAGDRARHADADERYGDRAGSESIRVTVQEAAVLQSFPPGYPWQGTKTQQFQQVGNAMPVLLAAAVLRQFVQPAARSEVAA